MPLTGNIERDRREMIRSGHSRRQAMAAALNEARKRGKLKPKRGRRARRGKR